MLRSDRLVKAVRAGSKSLAGPGFDRVTSVIRGRRKSLLYVGTALALAGAGSASAATVGAGTSAPARPAPAAASPARRVTAARPDAARTVAASTSSGHARAAAVAQPLTWPQVQRELTEQTSPAAAARGELPYADRLMPLGASGPQAWMPISQAQAANATTIVRQTLHKRLGLRSAVIAVATAMQESMLQNIDYGTEQSLGLFQQQPDCGWGSAAQIMDPGYAANAFLTALQQYQQRDPAWAHQPLWLSAQGVQESGFPFAYAKWEAQAAQLVQRIALHLV